MSAWMVKFMLNSLKNFPLRGCQTNQDVSDIKDPKRPEAQSCLGTALNVIIQT